jgi:hypothetical protein
MKVVEHAASIMFGGKLNGNGAAWFDNLELYIDGVKYQ